MAFDQELMRHRRYGYKWISVGKLKALLADIPDDYNVSMTEIGNIGIYDPNHQSEYTDWDRGPGARQGMLDMIEEDWHFYVDQR